MYSCMRKCCSQLLFIRINTTSANFTNYNYDCRDTLLVVNYHYTQLLPITIIIFTLSLQSNWLVVNNHSNYTKHNGKTEHNCTVLWQVTYEMKWALTLSDKSISRLQSSNCSNCSYGAVTTNPFFYNYHYLISG